MKHVFQAAIAATMAITLLLLPGQAAGAGEPKTVAILPFTMNADRDLGFLREGIMDMLASRLAWKDQVKIIEKRKVKEALARYKGPMDPEKAVAVGKALGAQYVILGSLTVFGESVSIDARILDVAKAEQLVTAFNQSKGMDEVIPTVDRFARDINAKIMGRVAQAPVYARGPAAQGGRGGALIRVRKRVEGADKASLIQRLKMEIIGMDAGDVDGDGRNEVVILEKDAVHVYKWKAGRFAPFRTLKGGWAPNYVYLSVADVDRNGRAEIYVTNLTASHVSSLAYEWQGRGFKKILSGLRWLLRAAEIPGKGLVLLGQKRIPDGAYRGPVKILKREGERLVEVETLDLPRQANVFNFVQVPLGKSGELHTVMLTRYDRLVLIDPAGEEIWKSDDLFGGTFTYMEDRTGDGRLPGGYNVRFLPSPLFLTDVNEDGTPEVVVCRNYSRTGRMTLIYREYSSGIVHFLTWDGLSLSTEWQSQKMSGAVVGYRVADVDHDARPELVIAVVKQSEFSLGEPKSQLVMYDLK